MLMSVDFGGRTWDMWPISVLAYVFTAFILYQKKYNVSYIFFLAIFWIYLTFAIDAVFFPMAIFGAFADASRQNCPLPQINLVPFYFGPYPDVKRVFTSNLQNILLTVPFGFGINFIIHHKTRRVAIMSVLLGSAFELLQYILSRVLGYCYRVVDVNDIMCNTIGVLCGYIFFRMFAWYYTILTDKLHVEHGGIMKYIYDVCTSKPDDEPMAYAKRPIKR